MRTLIAAALLLLSFTPIQALADADSTLNLPITHVSLYTSGVGYFERTGPVDGDASETILFPVDQVNDVLKSLVLLDSGGGSILPVTYGAQDPVDKQLQAFSVNVGDNPNEADVLSRMRGAPVSVSVMRPGASAPTTVTGTIVGVDTKTITLPQNQGTTQESGLTLFSDGDLQSVSLEDTLDIKILDDQLNQELSQELQVVAQSRDASKRPLTLQFSGHGRRDVLVGYVAQAPLWQTSYRLVLGKSPLLQGWANVQNTSQDDWNNIHLTLVSGRPVSFIQDLYSPIYIDRPVVAPRVASAPGPQSYSGNLLDEAKKTDTLESNGPGESLQAPVSEEYAAPAPAPAPAPAFGVAGGAGGFGGFAGRSATVNGDMQVDAKHLAQGVAMQGAQLGTALFSYDIKVPVTVPRQQSAMIPFVQASIQADPVSIYNNGVLADHPMAGVRMKNTSGLHLMGGPITVFDQSADSSGYVGDALIDDTEPNQTRLLSYAVDLGVDAATDSNSDNGQIVSLVISQGVLEVTRRYQQSTEYTFKNHTDKDRTIVVEHPNQGGDWKLIEPAKPTEMTANLYRFDVPVKAGASLKFTVRESYPEEEDDALLDSDMGTLVVYAKQGQESDQVRVAILTAITKRRAISETQSKIIAVQAQINAISTDQDRIRDNMKALQFTSALYKRYVDELNTQETSLQSLQSQVDTLNNQLADQQADLNSYVAHLNLS